MRRLALMVLCALALGACMLGGAILSPTPTPLPAMTNTATVNFTLTPTPTFTLTPTPYNTFTPEPSPIPSETPEGYYGNSSAGISMMLTKDWKKEEETSDGAVFSNDPSGLILSIHGFIDVKPTSLDSIVNEFLDNSRGDIKGTPEISHDQVVLGDGLTADQATIVVKNTSGYLVTIRIMATWKEQRNYVIMIIGPKLSVQTERYALKNLLSTVQFSTPQIYGLDRAKTLVLLGGPNPEAEDLDPAVTKGGSQGYTSLVYSGLVRLSPQLLVEPDLAESWMVSEDGLVYTFTLRSGLTFQNGKPLTAKDVKYSLERAADPETGSETAGTYLGDILGVCERLDGEADEIRGVKALDERRLEVTLDGAKPYFLEKLTYPTSYVVDDDNIKADPKDWMFKPNGSGPFRLDKFDKGKALVFQRFEGYHAPAKIASIAYLLGKGGSQLGYFQAGEVDVATLDSVGAEEVLNPQHPLHNQLQSATSLCTSYIQFDNNTPPMDDANVRKAFALAIDKDRLIELMSNELEGRADTILPPAMPGFAAADVPTAFDPEAARSALKASRYAGSLPKVTIDASGYGVVESRLINVLADMWRTNLGVQVEVEYIAPKNFARDTHREHGQLVEFGWCADYPDPENFLDLLFHTGSDFNVAGYSNPPVDALLEKARVEPDIAQRLDFYHQAERRLLEDYAAIPLWYEVSYVMVKPRVQGFIETPLGHGYWDLVSIQNP
jgi:oligopeptide transport system substrate-binding protein